MISIARLFLASALATSTFVAGVTVAQNTFQLATLVASDATSSSQNGFHVSMSGSRCVTGAYLTTYSGKTQAGKAYVYDRQTDGSWAQSAILTASDAVAQDNFGFSTAVSGDRILIGARQADHSSLSNPGAAYIFERQSNGTWLQVAKLIASDAAANAQFGAAVALQGDRAVVAARFDSPGGTVSAGSAYIFDRDVNGNWIETQKIFGNDKATGDTFGQSVALYNDRIIVGAYVKTYAGKNSAGVGYIFEYDPNLPGWFQKAELIASDLAASDNFGYKVGISGDFAVVGSPLADHSSLSNAGAAYVFNRDINGNWVETQKLTAPDAAALDQFGYGAAIDGLYIVVGATFDDINSVSNVGSAHVYEFQGTWVHRGQIMDFAGLANDGFGSVCAVSGGRAIVGSATKDSGAISNAGAGVVYRIDANVSTFGTGTPGCNGTQVPGVIHAPEVGMNNFYLTCTNAPPSSLALGLLTDWADVGGSDPFGIGCLLHTDLLFSTEIIPLDVLSDASGFGSLFVPIPNDNSLIGKVYYVQHLWVWSSCTLAPPYNLSSSQGLTLPLLSN